MLRNSKEISLKNLDFKTILKTEIISCYHCPSDKQGAPTLIPSSI